MDNRLKILNIWVDPLTKKEFIRKIRSFFKSDGGPHVIFAANPEKNFSVPRDLILYETFKNADLLLPDGIGMVIAVRLLYGLKIERVPGVEMMDAICALAEEEERRVFIFGSKEAVNKKAVEVLKKKYPKLCIVGRSHGYVKENRMALLLEKINRTRAEVLFVALGSPKQERWIARYKDSLRTVKVCQGIGGSLDTIAGHVKRAPDLWQKLQMEWLYRLIKEPKRIKRQKVLPIFVIELLKERLRRQRLER